LQRALILLRSNFAFFGLCFAAECTAKEAFQYAGPNIIFASGSPFRDVDLGANFPIYKSLLIMSWNVDHRHMAYI
jgi:hypothetical protein